MALLRGAGYPGIVAPSENDVLIEFDYATVGGGDSVGYGYIAECFSFKTLIKATVSSFHEATTDHGKGDVVSKVFHGLRSLGVRFLRYDTILRGHVEERNEITIRRIILDALMKQHVDDLKYDGTAPSDRGFNEAISGLQNDHSSAAEPVAKRARCAHPSVVDLTEDASDEEEDEKSLNTSEASSDPPRQNSGERTQQDGIPSPASKTLDRLSTLHSSGGLDALSAMGNDPAGRAELLPVDRRLSSGISPAGARLPLPWDPLHDLPPAMLRGDASTYASYFKLSADLNDLPMVSTEEMVGWQFFPLALAHSLKDIPLLNEWKIVVAPINGEGQHFTMDPLNVWPHF